MNYAGDLEYGDEYGDYYDYGVEQRDEEEYREGKFLQKKKNKKVSKKQTSNILTAIVKKNL